MTNPNMITDPAAALAFAMGGNARFTLVSKKTGTRYTFRFRRPSSDKPVFVQLLTGPDNVSDYTYLGFVPQGFEHSGWINEGSKGNARHPAFKAAHWALKKIAKGEMPEELEFWHEGRCCRCARVLTDPASIASGIGPECAKKEIA